MRPARIRSDLVKIKSIKGLADDMPSEVDNLLDAIQNQDIGNIFMPGGSYKHCCLVLMENKFINCGLSGHQRCCLLKDVPNF